MARPSRGSPASSRCCSWKPIGSSAGLPWRSGPPSLESSGPACSPPISSPGVSRRRDGWAPVSVSSPPSWGGDGLRGIMVVAMAEETKKNDILELAPETRLPEEEKTSFLGKLKRGLFMTHTEIIEKVSDAMKDKVTLD